MLRILTCTGAKRQIVVRRLERFAFALKTFLRQFNPRTKIAVEQLLNIALMLYLIGSIFVTGLLIAATVPVSYATRCN